MRIALFCLVIGTTFAGCDPEPNPAASTPQVVRISQPIRKRIAETFTFTGRTQAVQRVELQSQVSGYLREILFKPGELVQEGDLLFCIDSRQSQAKVLEAEGALEKARGQMEFAVSQVGRYSRLQEKGAASGQELEGWKARLKESQGAIKQAEGQLAEAKLNLEFCEIRAPLAGEISDAAFDVGDLVNPGSAVLATIVSLDPIHAVFTIDDATFQRVVRLVRAGEIPLDQAGKIAIQMYPAGDENQPAIAGRIDFVDNEVDHETASIGLRAVFANPFDFTAGVPPLIKPGLFVRVKIPVGEPVDRILVNERAIGVDQDYRFVYVVDEQNTIRYRRVQLGQRQSDGLQVVSQGLADTDRIVVSNLQSCRPGLTVNCVPVDMISLEPETEATKGRGSDDVPLLH